MLSSAISGACFGFVLGVLFPLVSTVIAIVSQDLHPTFGTVVHLHRTEPLLQVVDAMPLILMLAFGLVGRGRSELDAVIAKLEGRVIQRTAVMTAAKKSAAHADRQRSLLLARVAHAMVEQIDTIVSTDRKNRSPWAWESVRDLARHLRDLSRFEAVQMPSMHETFEPKVLVEGLRTLSSQSRTFPSTLVCTLDPDVPTQVQGDQGLLATTLELAVQLTAGLATGGTTMVTIMHHPGALGSPDRLHVECRNDEAQASSTNLRRILEDESDAEDTNVVRELVGVTLRTYAKALDAELAIRNSIDGTVVSILVPIVTLSAKAEAKAETSEDSEPEPAPAGALEAPAV